MPGRGGAGAGAQWSARWCACVEITINLMARIKKAALVNLAGQFVLSFCGERYKPENRTSGFRNFEFASDLRVPTVSFAMLKGDPFFKQIKSTHCISTGRI